MREYTAVENLIVHGYAHQPLDQWVAPPPGGLFHKCVVCPTKDNVPKNHKKDPNSWAIFHSMAHDGNFSAQHTLSIHPGNNVPLLPGTGAFQHPEEMKKDLQSMKNDQQLRKEAAELAGLLIACLMPALIFIAVRERQALPQASSCGPDREDSR